MNSYTTTRDIAVAATPAAIDEAVTRTCTTCTEQLPDGSPSDFWCSEPCQRVWQSNHPRWIADLPPVDGEASGIFEWSPPGTAAAAQRLLDDPAAGLSEWQRDMLRAMVAAGPDSYRLYVAPATWPRLVALLRKFTGRTE